MIYAVVRSSEMLSVSFFQWTSLSQQGVAWMVCLTILTGRFCMTWWAAKDLANADGTGLGSLETCHSVEGDRVRLSLDSWKGICRYGRTEASIDRG
eukprot:symbB.v1.2.021835.t1/scaffold1911.1/size96319/4